MTCEVCGEHLPSSARFCSHCGNKPQGPEQAFVEKNGGRRPVSGLIRCPDCGKLVSDDANQCVHCGKVIGRPALHRALEAARNEKEQAFRRRQAAAAPAAARMLLASLGVVGFWIVGGVVAFAASSTVLSGLLWFIGIVLTGMVALGIVAATSQDAIDVAKEEMRRRDEK